MATRAMGRRPGVIGERRFFTGMALVVLASTFLGFAPTYYLRFAMTPPHPVEPLNPLVFAHGLVFSAWVVLFAVQTGLVAAGRVDLHRRMGVAGVVLVAVMVPLAVATAIGGMHRPLTAPPGIAPQSWVAISILDVPVFAGLIVAGLVNRRRAATHKRLMLCAMVDMLRPSLGRLLPMLGVGGPLPLLLPLAFLLPLVAYDLAARGRVHGATLAGTAAVAGVTILTPVVWSTPAWLAFAAMLYRL